MPSRCVFKNCSMMCENVARHNTKYAGFREVENRKAAGMKKVLDKTIKNNNLTYEELEALFTPVQKST